MKRMLCAFTSAPMRCNASPLSSSGSILRHLKKPQSVPPLRRLKLCRFCLSCRCLPLAPHLCPCLPSAISPSPRPSPPCSSPPSLCLLQIKQDVEVQAGFVTSLAQSVREATFYDIDDVVDFVSWLDDELAFLVGARMAFAP